MKIKYYKKDEPGSMRIASFGVYIEAWHMSINNLAVLTSRNGGWYITMPSYKDKATEKWEKTVLFEKGAQQQFMESAKKALEEYAKQLGEVIA